MAKRKRIIPALDLKNGRVVTGVNFVNLRDAGDPVELAGLYEREGADELVFLDISATVEGRGTTIELVERMAMQITIPFTVAGGISKVSDMERLLKAGASKIAISTAAVVTPELISDGAKAFGSERIVVAIDANYNEGMQDWEVYTHGGSKPTGLRATAWAKRAEELGAGEILLTSMNADGTKDGFDIALTQTVAETIRIPVIASGGAGKVEDFYKVLTEGKADAALAASIFHFKELTIQEIKDDLKHKGVAIR